MISCTEFDGELYTLEGRAAFIAMAAAAMCMLNKADFEAIQSQKAWEGLGWYTHDLEKSLREINRQINGKDPDD